MEVTTGKAPLKNPNDTSSSTSPIRPGKYTSLENGLFPNQALHTTPLSASESKYVPSDHTVKPTTSKENPFMPALFKHTSPVSKQSSPSRNVKHNLGSGQDKRNQSATKPPYTANGRASPSTANKSQDVLKVEVSGYPAFAKPKDLWEYFTRFGKPTLEQVGRKSSIISFSTKEEAKAAINDSQKGCMYGQFLMIKPFHSLEESKKKSNNQNKITVDSLIEPGRIALTGTFEEQLGALLAAVRLTQEEVAALAALYSDVELVLQQLWPGCQAMPFGSLTTGLGVKSSDADCFMNIPPQYRHAQASFVGRARRVLLQYPHLFTEVIGIPRANTPIVKLLHVPTRTRCDLSFKTPLGALNSKLLAFLLHAEPRLVPLAVLAKYWAAAHSLSGTGRLTNYALTLLLLHFLQRRHPPLLPAVAALQGPQHRVLVDAWDCGFAPDTSLFPPRQPDDCDSVADLLGGFFAFYSTFDFESLVVCPFLGRPVDKAAFLDHDLLPEQLERYWRNVEERGAPPLRVRVPLCVQDPFEQSHNVASAVTPRLAQDLRAYFAFGAEAYKREKVTGCRGFLRTVLLEKPPVVRARDSPEYRVAFHPRQLEPIARDDWQPPFRQALREVFERILLLDLTPVGETEKSRGKKEKERYSTSFDKPLWKRKQYMRLFQSLRHMSFVERHARITEQVLKEEQSFSPVELEVILLLSTTARSVGVSVKMTDGDIDKFQLFGKYFLTVMQNLILGTLDTLGYMVVKESTKNHETISTSESNVVNSDSVADATKVFTSSNTKQAQLAEVLTSKEQQSVSKKSCDQIMESQLKESIEVDNEIDVGFDSLEQSKVTQNLITDESSSVSKTSVQHQIPSIQKTSETSAMELERSELENSTTNIPIQATMNLTEKEKTKPEL